MMWVVFGHIFLFWVFTAINLANMVQIASKPFFLIVEAGLFAVDVFFCLGGFFLAFIVLRSKINLKLCGLGILQRALRIWPAYILSMMFFSSLFMRLGSGPIWSLQELGVDYCQNMWRDIFFISNYFGTGAEGCMDWGWYLQVDFQLFIVGIFLLYLYSFQKVAFHITTAVVSVLSTVYVFVYTYIEGFKIDADLAESADPNSFFFRDIYASPFGRCVPYLMGLVLGVLFMEYRSNFHPI